MIIIYNSIVVLTIQLSMVDWFDYDRLLSFKLQSQSVYKIVHL